ncbi:MAG: hypothetical protein JWO80_4150 [Bryobacterales bacterium]|nr:hypothetical protein [Bryobacterales bacterium]
MLLITRTVFIDAEDSLLTSATLSRRILQQHIQRQGASEWSNFRPSHWGSTIFYAAPSHGCLSRTDLEWSRTARLFRGILCSWLGESRIERGSGSYILRNCEAV